MFCFLRRLNGLPVAGAPPLLFAVEFIHSLKYHSDRMADSIPLQDRECCSLVTALQIAMVCKGRHSPFTFSMSAAFRSRCPYTPTKMLYADIPMREYTTPLCRTSRIGKGIAFAGLTEGDNHSHTSGSKGRFPVLMQFQVLWATIIKVQWDEWLGNGVVYTNTGKVDRFCLCEIR